jgi:SSS family solute:Na+ symporter
MTLIALVSLYVLLTLGIGVFAARRVHSTRDFALAGQQLPLFMVITTTFATWFASETVLGVPARFMEGGLAQTMEDPYGAGLGLVLVGLFFARRLYRLGLITIGDFYRRRYSRGIELFASVVIMLSYLGWVAAQITAMGLVVEVLSGGALSAVQGMVLGTMLVVVYTTLGGMWSVALADLMQMIIMVVGLTVIAFLAGKLAGGPGVVLAEAGQRDLYRFLPSGGLSDWLFWLSASITLMLGTVPQQDVFQRVMAARSADAASFGPVIGGGAYMVFAGVPMFIGVAALLVMPDAATLLADDPEQIVPSFVIGHMPLIVQALFFGALLAAIMSTASATLLAPATTFVENILRNVVEIPERRMVVVMRGAVVGFAVAVLAYAVMMDGTSIYELVAKAYAFPVVGAFWPLLAGLYWPRASTAGARTSIVSGMGVWALLEFTVAGTVFPSVLGGVLAGGVGMWAGSLLWPGQSAPIDA